MVIVCPGSRKIKSWRIVLKAVKEVTMRVATFKDIDAIGSWCWFWVVDLISKCICNWTLQGKSSASAVFINDEIELRQGYWCDSRGVAWLNLNYHWIRGVSVLIVWWENSDLSWRTIDRYQIGCCRKVWCCCVKGVGQRSAFLIHGIRGCISERKVINLIDIAWSNSNCIAWIRWCPRWLRVLGHMLFTAVRPNHNCYRSRNI